MRVLLVRHGPAVARGTKGVSEADRPLTPEGRKKTSQAARGLRRLKLGLDRILTNPLPRARATAEILAKALSLPEPAVSDRLGPAAPPVELFGILKETGQKTVALVGHEPGLSKALSYLVGSPHPEGFRMKKAGAALVEIEKLSPRPTGELLLFLSPSSLRALGR